MLIYQLQQEKMKQENYKVQPKKKKIVLMKIMLVKKI